MRWRLALAATLGVIVGFGASEGLHSMIKAGQASKIKHATGSAITFLDAIERFRSDSGSYPSLPSDSTRLSKDLVPKYLPAVPTDAFGQAFVVVSYGPTPAIVSVGNGGFVVHKGRLIDWSADALGTAIER